MTRDRGQKYLCEFVYKLCGFIYDLSLSKITSYNTFTTLLLGLRLSASLCLVVTSLCLVVTSLCLVVTSLLHYVLWFLHYM